MAVETITHLTIKGYKSIKSLENFPLRPFNVLIGANGSGKSNFIGFFEMLQAMFSNTQGGLQSFIAQKGQAESVLHYGAKFTQELDGAIRYEVQEKSCKYSFSLWHAAPDKLYFKTEVLEYPLVLGDPDLQIRPIGASQFESEIMRRRDFGADVGLTGISKEFRDRLSTLMVYHFHDTSDTAKMRLTQEMQAELSLRSQAENIAVFLYTLKESRFDHFKRFLFNVQLMAPFIKDFVLEPNFHDSRYILLRWKDRSDEVFGPHHLSDGTLRAIALLAALLQPEDFMPSIMIFDEPELGLHPAAIGLIAGLLKAVSLNRQVIVATQSPTLIRGYEPLDIVVVESEVDELGCSQSKFQRLDKKELGGWLKRYDLGQLYEKNVTGGGPR